MFDTFRNAWKIPELRKKLLFTLLVIVIFRIGCVITVPYINPEALQLFAGGTGNMLDYLNMMSGGALSQCAIFALGVTPYINASIIIQLLTVAIPALERLSKEGEEGRRKLTRITRYTGAGIALVMSVGYYLVLRSYTGVLAYTTGWEAIFSAVVIVFSFTGGAQLLTWMGEQIDFKGIGNGISLLIFAGIVSRWGNVITTARTMITNAMNGEIKYFILIPVILILALAAIVFVVILTNAERRIPVQYAKRVVGRKMYGGQSSHIPLKVNMSGVMPIIFASALLSIPGTIASFIQTDSPIWQGFFSVFNYNSLLYAVLYLLLILAFNYFYVAIQYNPVEIANNLRKNNGAIPGIRPGKPTSDFITKCLSKITFVGAIFLGVIAVMPIILGNVAGMNIQLGGTSLLIVVGVALDTGRSMESYMLMRHHKGFLE
ncbi:preprotein translocase subunit SecY [Allofournierella massiliensis]|uniref:Protein translocase subunit SecY n=1 Tax=Allofournierella massiliensis TaxID=1650663 RepID=A0A4R1QJC8_9FIRM|nr:preprotein translocase subunit SecY [Fournierella massiliensis]TCL53646.1 protein translocase subunit secY/sec61 alpha [Fournierella massiliensis]